MAGFASPVRFLKEAAKLYPAQTAIVCGEERFTYQEYYERANRLGHALLKLGVRRGDRVAFLGYNSHCLLEAYYGVVQIGAVLVPLNIRLTGADFAFMINHAGAKAFIVQDDFIPVVDEIRKEISSVENCISINGQGAAGYLDYEELLQQASPGYYINPEMQENDVAELFYTSGTTGKPKGVMLSHRNIFANALNIIISLGLQGTDVMLHTIPLFHVNGWGTPHALTYLGGTHVMIPKFDAKQVCELIEREKVSICFMVPTMVNSLINSPEIGNYDLSSLQRLVVGGAASFPSLVERVEEKIPGCTYIGSYGQSEASPVVTNAVLKPHLQNRERKQKYEWQAKAGLPVPGIEMRVLNEKGEEVRPDGGEPGEIFVRGDTVMLGYWKEPEETAKTIIDGWLKTGDMATVDSEGYVRIVDRKKDIIISGGENISTIEIENVLYTHPAVLECAVTGYPDEKWGEIPKAFVVLKEDTGAITKDELIMYCRQHMANFKIPRMVEFLPVLPKSGTGKIMKQVLKQMNEGA